jgi:hypothetical protein
MRPAAMLVLVTTYASLIASVHAQAAMDRPDCGVADRWEFRTTRTPGGKVAAWTREIVQIGPGALAVRFRSGDVHAFDGAMNAIDPKGRRLWSRWHGPRIKWIAKERFELHAFHASEPPSDTVSASELERFMPGR